MHGELDVDRASGAFSEVNTPRKCGAMSTPRFCSGSTGSAQPPASTGRPCQCISVYQLLGLSREWKIPRRSFSSLCLRKYRHGRSITARCNASPRNSIKEHCRIPPSIMAGTFNSKLRNMRLSSFDRGFHPVGLVSMEIVTLRKLRQRSWTSAFTRTGRPRTVAEDWDVAARTVSRAVQ